MNQLDNLLGPSCTSFWESYNPYIRFEGSRDMLAACFSTSTCLMKPGTGTPLTTLKGFVASDNFLAASSFEINRAAMGIRRLVKKSPLE